MTALYVLLSALSILSMLALVAGIVHSVRYH